jgi:nucleotide-binding universal stress UspA family protein
MSATDSAGPPSVLVATDFSPTADLALDWGIEVAAAHGGDLHIVHALHLHGPLTDFIPSPPDFDEHLQGIAVGKLDELAARAHERGVAATPHLELGLPSEAIVEAARGLGAGLVIVGSRGHGTFTDLLLGSTAQRVVQQAPCPVLTLHPGNRGEPREQRVLLIPTDFSADARHAADTVRRLLPNLATGARLVLLHAYHLPVEYTAYGTIPTGLNYQQDVATIAEEKLAAMAHELRAEGAEVETLAREGYPPEVIVATARELAADVIALGTHGRTGLRHLLLGSNAERVVAHAPCAVLTVRHPERPG